MCQFLSALVLKNGDVLTHPLLDSHSDLVRYYELPDAMAHHQHFAKVELTPVNWFDASTWTWRLDEKTAPGWWGDVAASAEATLRARAQRMILTTGTKDLVVDGCWILGGDAEIREFRGGRIARMTGGTLTRMTGGTLTDMDGGTLTRMDGGTLTRMTGGTLTDMAGGTLTRMAGGTLTRMTGGTLTDMAGGTLTRMTGGTLTWMAGGTLAEQVKNFRKRQG